MQVVEILDKRRWEQLCIEFSANPFHTSSWLDSFENDNNKIKFLSFVKNNTVVGLIGLIHIQSKHKILKRFSQKLYSYCGPNVHNKNNNLICECLVSLKKYSIEKGYTRLTFGSYDYQTQINLDYIGYQKKNRSEYIIDLSGNMDEIFSRINRVRRREIKKSEKFDLSIHKASSNNSINILEEGLNFTLKRKVSKGFDKYNYFYMDNLSFDIIKKMIKNQTLDLYQVLKDNEVVTSLLILNKNKKAYALLIGNSEKGYKFKGSTYIYWKIVEQLKLKDVGYINLAGLPNDESSKSLLFFKKSLGSKEVISTGGFIDNLQSFPINKLAKIYDKFC
jgi:lipid II:glycine glycyltransferase (peptidoglycan interpeptide bridge formation enzyme)